MAVTFTRIDPTGADREALLDFLTGSDWPFHVLGRRTREDFDAAIDDGAYRDHDNDSFWVEQDELGRIGFLRLEDLTEDTPLFDLRLAQRFRGRGLDVEVLRAATDFVFHRLPEVQRFEGQTREDNHAMRKTFLRAGWVKEAHYRESWPVAGGRPVASVAYAILRRDWETGRTTPVPWDDEPA